MTSRVGDRGFRQGPANASETPARARASRSERQPAAQPEPGSLWDVAQAAAYINVPPGSIYKMTARKAVLRIPYIRLGGQLRFRRSDIDRWLSLLTVSNLDTLERVQRRAGRANSGHHQ